MGLVRSFTRNILSNFAGYAVSMVVGFLLTPYVLDKLGRDTWGLWTFIVTMTGYYGLCDLGIRSAVGHYVTRYWTLQNTDAVSRTVSTAVAITGGIAGVLILATAIIAFVFPNLIEVASVSTEQMRLVVLVMGCAVAINFPLSVFGAASYARQRFDIANALAIAERITAALCYVYVLEQGYGLLGVAIVNALVQTTANLARIALAFKLLPGLRVARRFVQRDGLRELFGFGALNAFVNAADLIVLNADIVVIGIMLGETAVAYYAGGSFVVTQCVALIGVVSWTLTPYANACDARGERAALRQLWLTGTRWMTVMISVLVVGIVFLGRDFLRIWIPADEQALVEGTEFTSSAVIMSVLACAIFVRGTMSCGKQILFGLGEMRFLARVSMLTAVLNVVASFVLLFPFGITGVAVGSVIAFFVGQFVIQPVYLARKLEIPLRELAAPVLATPMAVLGTVWAIELGLGQAMPVTGYGSFFVRAIVLTVPALIVGALIGTTQLERHTFWRQVRHRSA